MKPTRYLPLAIGLLVVGIALWWVLIEQPKNDKLSTTYQFV